MSKVIVLFEVAVKDKKKIDYLKRAGTLKEHLKVNALEYSNEYFEIS